MNDKERKRAARQKTGGAVHNGWIPEEGPGRESEAANGGVMLSTSEMLDFSSGADSSETEK